MSILSIKEITETIELAKSLKVRSGKDILAVRKIISRLQRLEIYESIRLKDEERNNNRYNFTLDDLKANEVNNAL